MYFEDLTGDDDIGWLSKGLPHMLITALEHSGSVEVVGYQRLFDILKLLGKEDEKRIDASTATALAKKARITTMVLGSIFRSGSRIRIDYEIQDVASGKLVCADKVIGEDPLTLADELGGRIRSRLDIEPHKDQPEKIADVTTNSPQAYRCYLQGLEHLNKHYVYEAEDCFKRALDIDSTFAMAYYRLAEAMRGYGALRLEETIKRALEHADNASWKESRYIHARAASSPKERVRFLQAIIERYPNEKEALLYLGDAYSSDELKDYHRAIDHYTRATSIDPLYREAYYHLSSVYERAGDYDNAILTAEKYISLAPDEPNPYDTKADIYARSGKIDLAIESYERALERRPDFLKSSIKLGHLYLLTGQYARAEGCYRRLCSSEEWSSRARGRSYLAYIPARQGQFDRALKLLDDGIAADRMEQVSGWFVGNKHLLKASILKILGKLDLSIGEVKKAMEYARDEDPDDPVYLRWYYASLLVETGNIRKAEEVAEALRRDIERVDEAKMSWYWYALGRMKLAKKDYGEAVPLLEKASGDDPPAWPQYSLARAYLESGRLADAVTEYEKIVSTYDPYGYAIGANRVLAHYYLGLAFEKSGWDDKATKQYERFLEIWNDADPGIPEIEDARQRLARLNGGA
jgi:tetratricopeptide (TPR) repeat protein